MSLLYSSPDPHPSGLIPPVLQTGSERQHFTHTNTDEIQTRAYKTGKKLEKKVHASQFQEFYKEGTQ